MSASRPWRQASRDLFAFSTTDRRDLNVAIMTVFEDAAVLRPSMTFEQIRAGLGLLGWDEPLEDDELDRALAALVSWRLLEATQDHSARYATPEEFERRNLNWSLTQHGIAAIGGLLHALETLRRAVSLQPAVLDAIADGLHDLHSLLTDEAVDTARVATRLAEVESHMASLVANVRQFNSHLQRLMREDATADDVFLDVKERTVTYLQEFVNGVDRPVRRVALGVGGIEDFGVATLLDRALTGANLAPVAGEDPASAWQAERWKRWEALRAWFAPTDTTEPRIRMLDSVARQAIVQLLRVSLPGDRGHHRRRGRDRHVAPAQGKEGAPAGVMGICAPARAGARGRAMENTQTECQAVLSRLYAYLDGEIAGGDAAEVDRHLEMCVQCARRFGFERELKELVRRKCEEGVSSPGLTDIIRERLRGIAE